ncbi:MAG: class I SAM-dependent methyltransferase [Phycisphaerae bacterium]
MNPAAGPTAADVKRANRRLYDAVADAYEAIDGRRDATLSAWIRSRLEELAGVHGDAVLLDVGSGAGVVTRAARGIFARTIALDLSPGILATAGTAADARVAADTDALPIADESVNVVTCFAVLHHLYDTAALVREVQRVLAPGGAFWSDHDMDSAFYRRFRAPLTIYRRLRGAGDKYAQAASGVDARTYTMAEFREHGVDSQRVVDQLRRARLEPRASFHWFGLTPFTNHLFGKRRHPRGWAPLLSIVATKAQPIRAPSASAGSAGTPPVIPEPISGGC